MSKKIIARVMITLIEMTEILVAMFGTKKNGEASSGCVMCSATWFKDTDSFDKDLVAMKANGCGKALKANNPYYGRLKAIKVGNNLQFGYSYQNGVNNHLEKNGEKPTFEAGKLPWGHWYTHNGVEQTNKIIEHCGNLYVRFYKCKNTEIRTTLFLDGKRVTDAATIADIYNHLKVKDDEVKTQTAAGLTPDEQVHPFAVGYKNIKHLSIGGGRYAII